MASEVLAIPEEDLEEFCRLLHHGLKTYPFRLHSDLVRGLTVWLSDMDTYLKERQRDD